MCVSMYMPGSQPPLGRFYPDKSHFLCFFCVMADQKSVFNWADAFLFDFEFLIFSKFRYALSNDRIEIFSSDRYHSNEN